MHRKLLITPVALLSGLLGAAVTVNCYSQTNVLQTEIQDVSYTNVPVSHAICLLAKQSPVPIDAIIDDTNDPPVTIFVEKATIAEILQKLLLQHPGHHAHEQSGLILILPDGLFNKQVFPLTQKLTKFDITCYSHNSISETGLTVYLYRFDHPENPALNVSLGALGVSRNPNYATFPHVRTFENQSIVEILTTISLEEKKSFYCYRLDKDFVKAQNKEWAEKKMGPTWWPDPTRLVIRCFGERLGTEKGLHNNVNVGNEVWKINGFHMRTSTLFRRAHILALSMVLVWISLGLPQQCLAETGVLQTVVASFSCSNVPIAVAVRNLSAYSPVPLNIVIDVLPQPGVSVSYQRATIGDILKAVLSPLPEYSTVPTNGTILLLPKEPIDDSKSPLTRKLDRFSVVYYAYVRLSGETNFGTRATRLLTNGAAVYLPGETNYVGEFFHTGQPELNVTFNTMLLVSEVTAKLGPIPRTRTFEDMTLIGILTVLSKEEHQSWSLSRVWPAWVAKNNKQFIDQHMGTPPWSHPEAPCYVVFWRPLQPNVIENPWYGP